MMTTSEAVTPVEETTTTRVTVNFAARADYPLVKLKFALFNSGIVSIERYRRDAHLLSDLRADSMRIDLGWGADWIKWTHEPMLGTLDNVHYDFREMDEVARLLLQHDVLPYWSYCYIPRPLQNPPGEFRSVPSSLEGWGEIAGAVAAHYKSLEPEVYVGYHEIYNEPDNEAFFLGDIDDYLAMYEYGVRAIRAANPSAVVGGPGLAFMQKAFWLDRLLDFVTERDLPLDFYSVHRYGDEHYWTLADTLERARQSLVERPAFATTEFHLNELNAFSLGLCHEEFGAFDRHAMAAALLEDFHYLLTQPDVTIVNWAQFMDSGIDYLGMVSTNGHLKAGYHAFKIYAGMPFDRCPVTISDESGITRWRQPMDIGPVA